ncbi:MAG: MBL fold metallo-hydrolase [Nitriliruptoraceae bacterium]|nr:MBL fold metallo-hydrolase [Nitriliruptoraceae bacterium]
MPEYTGHVEPDGEWQDRRDGDVLIRKLAVEEFDNNVYVVVDTISGRALLIDVAARPERLADAVAGFEVVAAVQTHGHWDHVRAWDGVRDEQGIEVWGHQADDPLFPRPVDRALAGGERISLGGVEVEVIHLPGHTPGSLLFLVEGAERPHLFSGDTLFPGGHGRTTSDEDHELIMDGLEEQIFGRLPDDTWVYPGHGDDTTLGAERPHLAEWRERGW